MKPRVVFDSQKKGIGLRIFLPELGFANANGHEFMFKVPKDSMTPYSWHHFCFNSDGQSYQVIVDGKQWYQGDHTSKGMSMSSSNIFLTIKFTGQIYQYFLSFPLGFKYQLFFPILILIVLLYSI